jgi:hypothetical protein
MELGFSGVNPIEVALSYTKSGPKRLAAMAGALQYIEDEGVPGDVVECGVWKGGNIILARFLCPTRTCWLYDTFTGMPKPGDFDHTPGMYRMIGKVGKDAVSLPQVMFNLSQAGVYSEKLLRFVEGPVELTLQNEDNIPDRIALLRLDTDWYESTKVELEILYPRLVEGGVLIIDDYGHWMGCKKAVDEYFEDRGIPEMQVVDYSCRALTKPFE